MPPRSARPAAPGGGGAGGPGVAERLHSAAIHLLRWLRREDDAGGVSAPRLSALSVVVFAGPVTLGQLAAAEQVRPPTMTRLVQALEGDGLVRREPDPDDGRVTWLVATARGRRLLAAARARRVAALERRLAHLDDEDRVALARAADVIERLTADAR